MQFFERETTPLIPGERFLCEPSPSVSMSSTIFSINAEKEALMRSLIDYAEQAKFSDTPPTQVLSKWGFISCYIVFYRKFVDVFLDEFKIIEMGTETIVNALRSPVGDNALFRQQMQETLSSLVSSAHSLCSSLSSSDGESMFSFETCSSERLNNNPLDTLALSSYSVLSPRRLFSPSQWLDECALEPCNLLKPQPVCSTPDFAGSLNNSMSLGT